MNKIMEIISEIKGEYLISTDKEKLDIKAIHHFLSTTSYWCKNVPKSVVETSIQHSLCFGIYKAEEQVGFARIITDYATVAYLGDVYVLEEHRGKGLSKWMIALIMEHPNLQGLRRWILRTSDAHELYRKFGWADVTDTSRWMEVHKKDVYS
jgi:GNAT superfamily N-acetyltransferase